MGVGEGEVGKGGDLGIVLLGCRASGCGSGLGCSGV